MKSAASGSSLNRSRMKQEITGRAKRHYHLHCSCGATVVAREKTATCTDCGKRVVFRRGWMHTVSTLGRTPVDARLWPPTYLGPAHTDHDAESNKRFKRVGSLILLVAAFAMLLFLIPEGMFQQWRAGAENPRPRDCDWTSIPVGDKHCHYESRVSRVQDSLGTENVTVDWFRVND
jgi:hypothetical protein